MEQNFNEKDWVYNIVPHVGTDVYHSDSNMHILFVDDF